MGDRVKFWTDRWCGDLSLHLAFPALYNFAANREASVESSLICQEVGDRRIWNVRFIQGPNDWEADVVDDFFRFLASNLPSVTDGDHLKWRLTKNGVFTIRSFYHKLHGSSSVAFPWKGIWKVKAPRCVSFFVWTTAWDRILTRDILRLRGFDFVDWWILCHCCDETVNHLLLHCGKTYRLWCFVFRIFGISWVLSCTVRDFLFSWWNWLGKHSSYIWNLVLLCLMWCIWKERNQQMFEDLDRFEDQLLALFFGSLFDWVRAWGLTSSDSIPLFLSSLLLCI